MKRILILTAMKEELKDVFPTETLPALHVGPFQIPLWRLPSKQGEILIAQAGIGPINAGSALTSIISKFELHAVVMLGLGGGIASSVQLGDICLSTAVIQHDAICSSDQGDEQMACGDLHLSLSPEQRKDIRLHASAELNQELSSFLKSQGHSVHEGILLSGSEFVGSHQRKSDLAKKFPGALMVDMEACAVAYLCEKAGIPFTVAKTAADTLQENPTGQYVNYLQSSKRKTVDVVHYLQSH